MANRNRIGNYSRPTSTPSHILRDLESPLKTFTKPATTSQVTDPIKLDEVNPVASYNWIDAPTPTIAVPGSPNIWTNANPKRVPQDSGVVLIDQNSYRMGSAKSPLLPIFAAIDDFHGPNYEYQKLDIVSDRNNLRKLLRWATGDTESFRIDVDRAGNTCLFTRREEKDSETVVGFKGFGHEYEKAATKPATGCEKTTGHHRIISINFGGLKVLLRFEVDACTGVANPEDSLAAAFSSLGIASSSTSASAAPTIDASKAVSIGIPVIHTSPRTLVSQSSLIEMKTRVSHRPLDWAEVYPQLYLSQTAYLYLAKHNRGEFFTVEKTKLVGDSMKAHAKAAEAGMRKLKMVLDEVLKAVREQGNGVGMSLVSVGGKLTLYKRKLGSGKPLSKEILSRFE